MHECCKVIIVSIVFFHRNSILCIDQRTWEHLQKQFQTLRHVGVLCDVYDRAEYKKFNWFLNSPSCVSLLMNTDGVSLFKLSEKSLWPVWLVVNELPPAER